MPLAAGPQRRISLRVEDENGKLGGGCGGGEVGTGCGVVFEGVGCQQAAPPRAYPPNAPAMAVRAKSSSDIHSGMKTE